MLSAGGGEGRNQGCAGVTIPVRESGTRDIPDFFPVRSGNPGEIREFFKTNLKRPGIRDTGAGNPHSPGRNGWKGKKQG